MGTHIWKQIGGGQVDTQHVQSSRGVCRAAIRVEERIVRDRVWLESAAKLAHVGEHVTCALGLRRRGGSGPRGHERVVRDAIGLELIFAK